MSGRTHAMPKLTDMDHQRWERQAALPVVHPIYRCAVCGGDAPFGFGVSRHHDRGQWACIDHREDVRLMVERT